MQINVTNKIAIPNYPIAIAMAKGTLKVDYKKMADNYFGASALKVLNRLDSAFTIDHTDKGDFFANKDEWRNPGVILIDGQQHITFTVIPEGQMKVDLVVLKDHGGVGIPDQNLTRTIYFEYGGLKVVKTPNNDYRALPTLTQNNYFHLIGNDSTVNSLLARLGIEIDKSTHISQFESVVEKQLKRFSAGLN